MKTITLLFSFVFCALLVQSQDVLYTENFGAGCNQGQLATSIVPSSGAWTISNTGTNMPDANQWYISAMENGMNAGECGAACGNNQTLHVSNITIVSIITIPADGGANYYASGAEGFCGLINCSATNRKVSSPVVNCSGYEDITLSFDYIEGGNAQDNASLHYNDGSGWILLDDLAKTSCCGGPCDGFTQGVWTNFSVTLPASAMDNPLVQIGFNWTNNDDLTATDPSFAVDNISIEGTSIGVGNDCPCDFNEDGIVNAEDLLLYISEPSGPCDPPCTYDLSGDGVVNSADLLSFLSCFGTICN